MVARFALVLAALATSSLSAGEPPPPLTLEPTSPWNVHYADDSCRLLRSFGKGEQETIFYAEQFAPTSSFAALVAGQPLTRFARGGARLGFSSGAEANFPVLGTFDRFGPSLLFTRASLNPSENGDTRDKESEQADLPFSPEQEAAVTWAEVRLGKRSVRLDLGPMDKPMAALRKCTDELVEHWGIDAEAQRHLTRKVQPASSPGSWMSSNDYPQGALARGTEGLVQFRMIVDADGKPTECTIQQSTRPAEFDDAVCWALMRRARFIPALDASGRPVSSYWRSTVRFFIG